MVSPDVVMGEERLRAIASKKRTRFAAEVFTRSDGVWSSPSHVRISPGGNTTLMLRVLEKNDERDMRAAADELASLRAALAPFAKFACDPPCERTSECHNCRARRVLEPGVGS